MRCIHLPGQIYTSELTHAANATHLLAVRLEAFAVDNGGARLVVLLLADPHKYSSSFSQTNPSL